MKLPTLKVAKRLVSVWYWATLVGLVVSVPLCIMPLGGVPLLFASFISATFYVLYDWYQDDPVQYPDEYHKGNLS